MKGIRINWGIVTRNILIVLMLVYMVGSAIFISITREFIEDTMFQIEYLNNKIETLEAENTRLKEEATEETQAQYLSCVEKNRGTFKITAYCACEKCCGKWAVINGGGFTASGTKVEEGRTIAVYPKQIPFGTEVHIKGMGTYIAEDTGSAIKENCIDIYFDSHEEALNFGVKYLEVEY